MSRELSQERHVFTLHEGIVKIARGAAFVVDQSLKYVFHSLNNLLQDLGLLGLLYSLLRKPGQLHYAFGVFDQYFFSGVLNFVLGLGHASHLH